MSKTKYICKICDFETDRMYNFTVHNESKKHIKNKIIAGKISLSKKHKIYTCKFCDIGFASKNNMYRHQSHTCLKKHYNGNNNNSDVITIVNQFTAKFEALEAKRDAERDILIAKHDEERKVFLELLKSNCKTVESANEAVKNQGDAIKTQSKTAAKSMRTLTYAIKHLTKAPPIKKLKKDEAIKLLEYTATDQKVCVETMMIKCFENNNLSKFLGKIVINECIKDKELQYVWTCDVSRLCFIVRQKLSETHEHEWITDKEGIKFRNFIIRPLLDEAATMISIYHNSGKKIMNNKKNAYYNDEESNNSNSSSCDTNTDKITKRNKFLNNTRFENLTTHLGHGLEVSCYLKSDEAEIDILEYIAPYFNLSEVEKMEKKKKL
jgi:hypothetical protein